MPSRKTASAKTPPKPTTPHAQRKVRAHAKAEAARLFGPVDFSVQVIREMRGPLDEEQERELTLAQRDLLPRRVRQATDVGELRPRWCAVVTALMHCSLRISRRYP